MYLKLYSCMNNINIYIKQFFIKILFNLMLLYIYIYIYMIYIQIIISATHSIKLTHLTYFIYYKSIN